MSRRRIAAGLYHSLAVQETKVQKDDDPLNAVFGFGSNRNHMLGLEEKKNIFFEPERIPLFNDKYIAEVGCGGSHSVFLEKRPHQDGGKVWVVGLGTSGRLGLPHPKRREEYHRILVDSEYSKAEVDRLVDEFDRNSTHRSWVLTTPVVLTKLKDVMQISCGVDHTLAITEPGIVHAWGLGSFGNLGTGTTDNLESPQEVKMPNDSLCCMVAAGAKHSMALTRDGGLVFSWGHGGNGRLGQGDGCQASLVPGKVAFDSGFTSRRTAMEYIAVGEAHSAAVDVLGNVFCWGAGSRGRTGHGEENDSPAPKQVRSLGGTPCTEVALGTLHSIALAKSGAVYAWGSGSATGHEAAGGLEAVEPVPKELTCAILKPRKHVWVVHITAGCFHSLALLTGGEVVSWGNGSQGRLGHGRFKIGDQAVPAQVSLGQNHDADVREPEEKAEHSEQQSIFCGGMHSGLMRAGELWLWGSNEHGQLGFGDRKNRPRPSRLLIEELALNKAKIDMVALGLEHSILLTTAAATGARLMYSWGRNQVGQLGLGHTGGGHADGAHTGDAHWTPKQVTFIVDAKKVAAGEDHSAAILSSGELYTWGSSQSGKLGHGSGVGSQNYPRQLRLSDQVDHVSCGAQHTAIINVQGQLFTFGAGWYGRLGHGDMSNLTSPKQVERFDSAELHEQQPWDDGIEAPRIRDVKCATFHTCIVAVDGTLWCCGRDSTICEPTHVYRPIRFGRGSDAFRDSTKVKILAVGAFHTMCATEAGDLLLWGENNKGQLGQSPKLGKSSQPIRVHCRGLASSDIIDLAAGYSHSLAMLKSSDVYAWGCTGDGRLGLPEASHKTETMSWEPNRVDAQWIEHKAGMAMPPEQPEEEKDAQPHGEEVAGELPSEVHDEDEHEHPFGELTRKMRGNPDEQTVAALRKREQDLCGELEGHFRHISALWDKPAAGAADSTEWELRSLRERLDCSLCRNLRRLDLSEEYPNLDGLSTPQEVSQVLVHYEELIWMLQQQPCYLARLFQVDFTAHYSHTEKLQPPHDIVPKIVERIYQEVGDARTRHLFMALICRVFELETNPAEAQKSKALTEEVELSLELRTSKVHTLLCTFMSHPFFADLHRKLFDADDEDSLLMKVCRCTLRPNKAESALFAMIVEELFEWENIGDDTQMSAKERAEQLSDLKYRLGEYHNMFQMFLGAQGDSRDTFATFLGNLEFGEEILTLVAGAEDCVRKSISTKVQLERKLHEPIASLLTSTLGHLLECHEAIMCSQGLIERFKKRMRKTVEDNLKDTSKQQHGSAPDRQEFDARLEDGKKRMHFNMRQLGRFLIQAAKKQVQPGSSLFNMVKDLWDNCLLRFAKRHIESGRRDIDDLGTQLTVDLYTSHYDTSEHFVVIQTSELLHLSNLLWLCIEQVTPGERPHEERLFKLLDKIQPPGKTRESPRKSRVWFANSPDLNHNFMICHRFLEFHKDDLCFCCECEAPIPRILAIEKQRQRRDIQLLNVYPDSEGRAEFCDLERVIANRELSIDLDQSKNLVTLKYMLEETQKAFSRKLHAGSQDNKSRSIYVLLSEIEKGKRALDLLRNSGVTLEAFKQFRFGVWMSRERHFKYLSRLGYKLTDIKKRREAYDDGLKKSIVSLKKIVMASESANVPVLIKNKAADTGVRLRLLDAEKLRKKEEKSGKEFSDREGPADLYSSAEYSLYNLLAKRVVRRMGGDDLQREHRNIFFTFNCKETGDWEVVVIHRDVGKSHMLCTLRITVGEIEKMKRAGKAEKREFNNGFVVMSCFSLLQLLARIRTTNFKT